MERAMVWVKGRWARVPVMAAIVMGSVMAAQATPLDGAAVGAADEQAVLATDRAFHAASITDKEKAWGDFAADDASAAGAHGKAAVQAFFAGIYAKPGFRLDWEPGFVRVFGDYAVSSGSYMQHVTAKTGDDITSTGTYLTVWARQKDGTWRFAWDGGTMDRPKSP